MRYLKLTGKNATEVAEDRSAPLPHNHVRVKIAFAGLCHSDLGEVALGQGELPRRLGHEAAGIVVESAAPSIAVGARVIPYASDLYATETVVPADRVVLIDQDCSLLDAALAEPLACVIGGLELLSLRSVDEVSVVGAGFMGLLAIRWLAAAGHRVIVIEPRANSRGLVLEAGAVAAVDPGRIPVAMLGKSPVVIEATGVQAGLDVADRLLGIDGTLGILGYHQSHGGMRTVEMARWNFRAQRVINLHNRDAAATLRWIDRAQRSSALGTVRPSLLVSSTITLDELPRAFTTPAAPDAIKTVVGLAAASE